MLSIDARILSFVAWHGEIPPTAERVEDFRAREHPAAWIQRFIGGRSVGYVAGFTLAERWWALFFDRVEEDLVPDGAEVWSIESYDSDGKSWSGRYFFWPEHACWRHQFFAECGEDYGRALP